MACDIIVAAANATFALTPAKLGVPYNVSGMPTFLNGAPLRLIKEMAFTAKPISAERALAAGLINHLLPSRSSSDSPMRWPKTSSPTRRCRSR